MAHTTGSMGDGREKSEGMRSKKNEMEYQTQTQDKVSMAYLPFTNFPRRLTGVWLDLNCRFRYNQLLTKRIDESSNTLERKHGFRG